MYAAVKELIVETKGEFYLVHYENDARLSEELRGIRCMLRRLTDLGGSGTVFSESPEPYGSTFDKEFLGWVRAAVVEIKDAGKESK